MIMPWKFLLAICGVGLDKPKKDLNTGLERVAKVPTRDFSGLDVLLGKGLPRSH